MSNSLNILFEDNSIIVIAKPRGLAVQSAKSYEKDAVSIIREHLRESDNDRTGRRQPYVGIVHRLDQPVAGIVVFAKTAGAAGILSKQIQSDFMNKHYVAKVEGIIPDNGIMQLENMIYKDPKTKLAVIADESDRKAAEGDIQLKRAILSYSVIGIDEEDNTSLVSISLKTGRFHQIRAQFSKLGHPIVGDAKYGSVRKFNKGIALIADELTFVHPVTGEMMEFSEECDFA